MIKVPGFYETLRKERGLKEKHQGDSPAATSSDPTPMTQNFATIQTAPHTSINDTQNVSTLQGNNIDCGLGKSFNDTLHEIDQKLMMFDSHTCINHGIIAAETRATEVDSNVDSSQPLNSNDHVTNHVPSPNPDVNLETTPCNQNNATPKTWKRMPRPPQEANLPQQNTLPHKRNLTLEDELDQPNKKRVLTHESEFGLATAASQPHHEQ